MRVALVTTWGTACGIAEHSAFLTQAVQAADPTIEIVPITNLHPSMIFDGGDGAGWDLVVLNYQAALHSQWTPDAIRQVQRQHGLPVQVIYHDTGVPCSEQCVQVAAAADATVIHEPCKEFYSIDRVYYWRMGVPDWGGVWEFDRTSRNSWCGRRPILGSIGFPFPWKNYDVLAEVTAAVGWALLLIAPGITVAAQHEIEILNPHHFIYPDFVPAQQALAILGGCDATAFLYTCANTGQSAAILQGIAARKPVFAIESCRQFRALYQDPLALKYIRWCTGFAQFADRLPNVVLGRVDPGMVALATQDGWPALGVKYARLWHALTAERSERHAEFI